MKQRRRKRAAEFGAPWGRVVILVTVASVLLLGGLSVVLPIVMSGEPEWARYLASGVLLTVLFGTAPFSVRGYALQNGELLIQRLFWRTRLSLAGLNNAYIDPEAMRRSLRTAGNGGLFAFTGWFRNKKLGSYRAWVTDPARCVVLEFEQRKWVVSPDQPAKFIRVLGFEDSQRRRQR